MSISNWAEGELFTARIYKRLTARPDVLWANTYEIRARAVDPAGEVASEAVLRALAAFESLVHLNDVQFDRGVFSTLQADSEPYNPTNFVTVSLTDVVGARDAGSAHPVALDVCLFVRRVVGTGRQGRLLYRRCLTEFDVEAPAGDFRLSSVAQAEFAGHLIAPLPAPFGPDSVIDGLTNLGVDLVMVGSQPIGEGNIRQVTGLSVGGVTVKDYNNAYYNRRTPAAP